MRVFFFYKRTLTPFNLLKKNILKTKQKRELTDYLVLISNQLLETGKILKELLF